MNITFKWNKSEPKLINDLGINQKLNLFMANTAMRLMNPFVPMDTGALSQTVEVTATDKVGKIHYQVPYAHYQYTGVSFNFSKEKHPLATHHWDKAMMLAKKNELIKSVEKYRKGLAK